MPNTHTFKLQNQIALSLQWIDMFSIFGTFIISWWITVLKFTIPLLLWFFLVMLIFIDNKLQIQDVYETAYDTCGQFWPYIHHYIYVGLILMQITMIGLFGLKSKPAASVATIPLLLLTVMFNEYCKARFLPSFWHYSVQVCLFL